MFFLSKPSDRIVTEFLEAQSREAFNYSPPGMTRGPAPSGFVTDSHRCRLGDGPKCYQRAAGAVKRWAMFNTGWVKVSDPSAPILEGVTVGIVVRHYGFWSVHAARVVYVINEPGRFGFAYGALKGHAQQGEERFLIEYLEDGSVWYDLRAYSRPGHWMVRIGYPVARRLQKRFVRDSMAAMRRASGDPTRKVPAF